MIFCRLHDYYLNIISGKRRGVMGTLIFMVLLICSCLYGVGLFLRRLMLSLRQVKRLPVPVVSVGNITVGGTGKTPLVIKLAEMLGEDGRKVGVISRGYKGGDEAMMLAEKLPGAQVITSRDRYAAGLQAVRNNECDALVLDDAFHKRFQLARDLEVITVDARNPFGYGRLLPAGLLREPSRCLAAADVILLTNSNALSEAALLEIEKKLARYNQRAKLFRCRYRLKRIRRHTDGEEVQEKTLSGKKLLAFCGIGNPVSFFSLVAEQCRGQVVELSFPDHHLYGLADLSLIKGKAADCDQVITTEKDAVRLSGDAVKNLLVVEVELAIENEQEFDRLVIKAVSSS